MEFRNREFLDGEFSDGVYSESMSPAMDSQREHAQQLLSHLDNSQLAAVVHLLEVMTGPVTWSLANAPYEEDEITPELAAELDRAAASPQDKVMSHEELLRQYGVTSR